MPYFKKELAGKKVTIDAADCFIVTGNDGGYLSGHCIACGKGGWFTSLIETKHEKNCPIGKIIKGIKQEIEENERD
jgi:hypothetical protein